MSVLSRLSQHAKKVLSNNLELVDFAIGLVNSVLNLSDGQVKFWGIQITEELLSILLIKIFLGGGGPVKMTLGPVHAKFNYSLSKWQADIKLTFFAPCELGENVKAFFP